jgi:hypothetical protein
MSAIPEDYRDRLALREQIARIDKMLIENQKLAAERDRFHREPWLLILAALIAAFAVIVARLPELIQAFR